MNILASVTSPSPSWDSIVIEFFKSGFNGVISSEFGTTLLIVCSLLISIILSSIIGIQREKNGHPAGLRTHILISLGSTLIMILSLYVAEGDPMRLAAAGVTGIGFLGAGSIIQNGFSVKGLTSAASIWVTMAIGMACGSGYFLISVLTTAITLLCLTIFQKIEFFTINKQAMFLIVTELDKAPVEKITEICEREGFEMKDLTTSLVKQNDVVYLRITFKVSSEKKGFAIDFLKELNEEIKPIESKIMH